MKIKYYDLLANLISGFLLLSAFTLTYEIKIPKFDSFGIIIISFIVGYFINTLGSWFEEFYRWTWGKSLIDEFFESDGIWKVRYYDGKTVKDLLEKKYQPNDISNKKLFQKAMQITNIQNDQRVNDFNESYAFSRSLLTTILILFPGLLFQFYTIPIYYVVSILLLFIAWLRFKQRNAYYIREVLSVALISLMKEST